MCLQIDNGIIVSYRFVLKFLQSKVWCHKIIPYLKILNNGSKILNRLNKREVKTFFLFVYLEISFKRLNLS